MGCMKGGRGGPPPHFVVSFAGSFVAFIESAVIFSHRGTEALRTGTANGREFTRKWSKRVA
jgi:hypothetical protein